MSDAGNSWNNFEGSQSKNVPDSFRDRRSRTLRLRRAHSNKFGPSDRESGEVEDPPEAEETTEGAVDEAGCETNSKIGEYIGSIAGGDEVEGTYYSAMGPGYDYD